MKHANEELLNVVYVIEQIDKSKLPKIPVL
jgi:hypothetical protein